MGKQNILSRDEILAASDIQIEMVEVPEWGGSVYVKGMTGAERDRFEAGVVTTNGQDSSLNMNDLRAKLCAICICDEAGKPLFSSRDVKELTKKSASALQRVFKKAQSLSGLTDDDLEELSEGLEDRPLEDSASD